VSKGLRVRRGEDVCATCSLPVMPLPAGTHGTEAGQSACHDARLGQVLLAAVLQHVPPVHTVRRA
jgi:hypothetical protein